MSHLVLIAGVSRSGKSSLAENLKNNLSDVIHLEQDHFVKAPKQIPRIHGLTDWDTPKAIDWSKWKETIENSLTKSKIVLAEGIFAFNDKKLLWKSSMTILMSLEKREFIKRRKQETRWGEEPDWFIEHVWQSHLKNHNPFRIKPTFQLSKLDSSQLKAISTRLIRISDTPLHF